MIPLAATSPVLAFAALLASGVWVGGFVAIMLVTRIIRGQLEPAAQVEFFRALGRTYGIVGGSALLVALGAGAGLLAGRAWDATVLAAIVLAVALVAATVAGVVQARGMSRLRAVALREGTERELGESVNRGARRAAALRALIGVLSLGLLAVAAVLAT